MRPGVVALACAKKPTETAKTKRPHGAWAELMRRAFAIDVQTCPKCSGRLRLMAIILNPRAAVAILRSLGLPHQRVTTTPTRGPPHASDDWEFHAA
ncbi:MAG: ATP-dependent helicase HrpA [Sandaracinaceae bacterium]|nr:ATP-dependent helicase HrpA [Sandaracinaceae bacterium]